MHNGGDAKRDATRNDSAVKYRRQADEQWRTIVKLGRLNGGTNDGIAIVKSNKRGEKLFTEKSFGSRGFGYGIPRREIQVLHQVSRHPNITSLVDHFIDKQNMLAAVYLEYCDGGSWDNVVVQVAKGRHVHERKVWSWFTELMEALAFLHRGPNPEYSDNQVQECGWSRVFHRDIKPGNIFLKTEGDRIVAKLGDFGCAMSKDFFVSEHDTKYAITQSVWANGYDAPEHPIFSEASDVWQVGISVMALCTGNTHPKSGNNPRGEEWDQRRPAGIKYSSELNFALQQLLEIDRKKRTTAYPMCKVLSTWYAETMVSKLPIDKFPLEIFDKSNKTIPQVPEFRSGASPNFEYPKFEPGFDLGPRIQGYGLPGADAGYNGFSSPMPKSASEAGNGFFYPSIDDDDDEGYDSNHISREVSIRDMTHDAEGSGDDEQ